MKHFQRIWKDVKRGENIDTYVTVVVAVILAVLNLLGGASQQLVSSLTIAILALITITNLVDRHHLENLNNQLTISSRPELAEKFPPEFVRDIETAKELWLTGMHHSSAMSEHYDSFAGMLRNGGVLKVMTADPDGAACEMTAMRFAGYVDAQQERMRTRANLTILRQLADVAPGKVEIRTIDYLFEYNAFLINPSSSDGVVYIQRYTFKTLGGARKPKLVFRPADGHWYDLFRTEVLAIWECGKPLD